MKKWIWIGMAILNVGFLVAAITAPILVVKFYKEDLNQLNSKIVNDVRLTSSAQSFFNEQESNQVVIETAINTGKEEWATWFEAVNASNEVVPAIEAIENVTLEVNETTNTFDANISLVWKEGFSIDDADSKNFNVPIKAFEVIELNYLSDEDFKLNCQNIIWTAGKQFFTLDELNEFLLTTAESWNVWEETDFVPLTDWEIVGDASKIDNMEFKATNGTNENEYNIEWIFNPKLGYVFSNPSKTAHNLLLEIPENTLAHTFHDSHLIKNTFEPELQEMDFSNLAELNAALENIDIAKNLFIINHELVSAYLMEASNGDGQNQYDIEIRYSPLEGLILTNPIKILKNVQIISL